MGPQIPRQCHGGQLAGQESALQFPGRLDAAEHTVLPCVARHRQDRAGRHRRRADQRVQPVLRIAAQQIALLAENLCHLHPLVLLWRRHLLYAAQLQQVGDQVQLLHGPALRALQDLALSLGRDVALQDQLQVALNGSHGRAELVCDQQRELGAGCVQLFEPLVQAR